ncbi:MAG: hypothetical protein AABZ08_11455 [Planctomycetota bacterium]
MTARCDERLLNDHGDHAPSAPVDWQSLGERIRRAAMAAASMEAVDQRQSRDASNASLSVESGT